MDEITIFTPRTIEENRSLSKELSVSALMPEKLRNKPADVFAIVLTGSELGLAPMMAIRAIHIINGKPTLSAGLMGALVKRRKDLCEYLTLVESSPEKATWKTKRKGEDETVMSFTMEDAKRAGLASNPNYQKHPANMLRARGLSNICQAVYQDVVLGLYDSDSDEIEERDVTPETPVGVQEHVNAVKTAIKAQLKPQPVEEDAEIIPPPAKTPPVVHVSVKSDSRPKTVREEFEARIAAAKTRAELNAVGTELVKLPAEDKEALKASYHAKKASLGPA